MATLRSPDNVTRNRVRAAFGAANRNLLIDRFLTSSDDEPWKAVYKLLLWIDKTTGLAHCYESDKCQPGKNWHVRSLRFHEWLAASLGVVPASVGADIDWLFRHVAEDHAHFMVEEYQKLLRRAVAQRTPFLGRGFPEAGEDPAIVAIIREVLGDRLTGEPTQEEWRELARRIRELIAVENKRKNIVGEGFEDVLAAVVRRFDVGSTLDVRPRRLLHDIPGFANQRAGDKPAKVDLALVRSSDKRRVLVTAKWSTRADREEQFRADFGKYLNAESINDTFDYVLITNEFDPARLKRACDLNAGNSRMLTTVVHISPDALRAVYGAQPEQSMRQVLDYIDSERIVGLDQWLKRLAPTSQRR
jgi:hypothetical protein